MSWHVILIFRIILISKRGYQSRLRFVMRNYKRDSSVSTMIQQLKWQSLEERRAVSRLTFTYYKALHKITVVNLDHLKSSKSSRPTYYQLICIPYASWQPKNTSTKTMLPITLSEWNLLRDHVKSKCTLRYKFSPLAYVPSGLQKLSLN